MTTAITELGKQSVKLAGAATVLTQLNDIVEKITNLVGMPFMSGLDYLISMISANTTEATMKLFESVMTYLTSNAGMAFIDRLSNLITIIINANTALVDVFIKVTNLVEYLQKSSPVLEFVFNNMLGIFGWLF
jgi:hypothetical protein